MPSPASTASAAACNCGSGAAVAAAVTLIFASGQAVRNSTAFVSTQILDTTPINSNVS